MKLVVLLLFIGVSKLGNALSCPVAYTQKTVKIHEKTCWDRSSGDQGCCEDSSCVWMLFGIKDCDCHGKCKGWSVDTAKKLNFNFPPERKWSDERIKGVTEYHGADSGYCSNTKDHVHSVRTNSKSCVKLWERIGCNGKSTLLKAGSILNIQDHGFSSIKSISGCDFRYPDSVQVKLYQHNFWSLFGSTEDVRIDAGKCTQIGEWWRERVSMIRKVNDDCFMLWDRSECSGNNYCDCGKYDVALNTIYISRKTSWNNQVRSLSLCNYP